MPSHQRLSLSTDSTPVVGWLPDPFTDACWSREAAHGTTSCKHKGDLTDEDVNTLLRQHSMGSDHGCHLLCAALYPHQSCFQHSGNCSCHRSSTDKPVGFVPSLRQPMVGLCQRQSNRFSAGTGRASGIPLLYY